MKTMKKENKMNIKRIVSVIMTAVMAGQRTASISDSKLKK